MSKIPPMVAAVFEARMGREQAERLAGVGTAGLLVDGDLVRLVAFWKDRETLDRYIATAPVLRGTELMRKVGVEPEIRVADVLELG